MNTKERKVEKRKAKEFSFEKTAREVSARDKFWCNRNGQFMYTKACINRQDKSVEGCVSCAQGSIVRKTLVQLQDDPELSMSMTVKINGRRRAIQF